MEVVIYKAIGRNGYLYDMSFSPNVDFEVLKQLRGVKSLEILTPNIPIETGEIILNDIYGKSLVKKFISSHDFIIKRDFRRFKIRGVNISLTTGSYLPGASEVSKIEDIIAGRVITLQKLCEIFKEDISRTEIIEIVQMLYCERRIRIMPSARKLKKTYICSFCEKPICNNCCLGFKAEDVLLYAADNYNISAPRKINYKAKKMNECLTKANDAINNFTKNSKKTIAMLWCVPKSFDYHVLSEAISNIVINGGRILYITHSNDMKIVEGEINGIFDNLKIRCIEKDGISIKDMDVVICAYNNYICFHKAFDLVIYDSMRAYIDKPLNNMIDISYRAVKENGKLINITAIPELKPGNKVDNSQELITIPVTKAKSPTPEPLIVISRTFRDQIPEIAIDLVRWSIKDKLKIIIFAPVEELQRNILNNLIVLGGIDEDLVDFSTPNSKEAILKLKRKEIMVVISTDIKDVENEIEDLNIIVINADNPVYNRYILVNMASMAELHNKKKCGQVMYIVEKENDEVSVTKERIRGINKIAWENGFMKI